MIRLLVVGDGERDAVTVHHLVAAILCTRVEAETRYWARLNTRGSGYGRKLRFATRQAIDSRMHGLIAVVDRDKAPKDGRLEELREARDEERMTSAPFPTAVGEADPHGEAWLLDDGVAVRRTLGLDPGTSVPTYRTTNDPKGTLNAIIAASERHQDSFMEILAEIARAVDVTRCIHKRETGFERFEKDVRSEFGPLIAP